MLAAALCPCLLQYLKMMPADPELHYEEGHQQVEGGDYSHQFSTDRQTHQGFWVQFSAPQYNTDRNLLQQVSEGP